MTEEANPAAKKSSLLKNVICLLIILGAGIFVTYKVREAQNQSEINKMIEEGNYELLLNKCNEILKAQPDDTETKKIAANCCLKIYETPGLSHDESLSYLEKAYNFDPESLDPQLIKALEQYKSKQNKTVTETKAE